MKLLSIIETLGKGGAERVLVNTLPELQKQGIDCEVAILFERDDLVEELESQGIKVYRLNLSYKWNIIEGIIKLLKLVKNNNYDIIHAHLFFAYFYTGLIKFFQPKVKTVTTFHNLAYNIYPSNTLVKKIRKKLDETVVNKLIDNKVAVSTAVKDHFKKHLKIPHINLIFNSFPLNTIDVVQDINQKEVLGKYLEMEQYDIFTITPGRLVKEKGHIYLLEAIEKLNKNYINLCHFIVGSGPLEKEIQNTINDKQLSNVILISDLEQNDLFALIRACTFVVIPSISEGFGMVIGEAMALEKPVIASNLNGIIDLIGNEKEGLLIPSKDSQALADVIERLYNDKELQTFLAKNAKEKIKLFDTKIIAKQWKAYYEEMLD